MNLLSFSAIFAVIVALDPAGAQYPKPTEPPAPVETTTLPPIPMETYPSPSPVDLETTVRVTRGRYPMKKTHAPEEEPTTAIIPSQPESVSEVVTERSTPLVVVPAESSPLPETPAPIPETPAPLPETPAPLPETPAPLPETPAPLPETPAPLPETPAPLPETPAPLPETPAPLPDTTPAPLPETSSILAPVETAAPYVTEAPRTYPPSGMTPAPTLPPVDFDCRRRDDGYYADPKNKCSSKFYACVGGLARRLDCSSPDLVYEPETQACERRQDSFRCTGTRKTTMPTTPRRSPTPPVKLPIDCSKLDDGWYPDPQKKCSHVFYSCSNGIGSRFLCPGNMYYDKESNMCEAFQDVIACAGKRPPTTPRIISTNKPPVTEKLPINCLDKPSGLYPDPLKKCSSIYYVCSNGDGLKRSCPVGLYFHAKKQLCDYYDEIFDCSGKVKPPTKPPTVGPSPASIPPSEFDCKGKADGSYTPADKKCSNIYYRCVGGISYKLKCPEELYYDIKNDLCDRWFNLFVCSGKKPTSPAPTTTTMPRPTEKLPIDCSTYDDGDFPDPEKKCSNVYYSCSNNVGSRRLCPEGLYFDKELYICDSYAYVMDCSGKPRPASTLAPTKASPPPKYPYNCERRTDGNYPAGKCLNYYWSCVSGTTGRGSCPDGTIYDHELDQCGYRHEIPACGGVRPTTKKP